MSVPAKVFPKRYGTVLSVSVKCEGVTPLRFLQHAKGQARFLWASPGNRNVIAGFGAAVELSAWGEARVTDIEAQAKALFSSVKGTQPKLFGGFAFRDDFVPENAWASFPPALFVLPHFQLELSPQGTFLSVHAELQGDDLSEDELREALLARRALLQESSYIPEPSPSPTEVRDLTSFTTWETMLEKAQDEMRTSSLQKVVLARTKEARFAEPVSPLGGLEYLEQTYPDCYRFLFEPRPGHAFLGATPELLVETQGREARTMALAGSAPRGENTDADLQFEKELQDDPKERLEHELVSKRIVERLEPLGKVTQAPTDVLKLSNIQHLHTAVKVELREKTGVLPLLSALHPTPALGGEPLKTAQQLIGELESLPRGWFAAPIGFLDSDLDGAFAVAIRSAVLQSTLSETRAWLFAGAGIVPMSVPAREWAETDLKFRPMLRALGAEVNEVERG